MTKREFLDTLQAQLQGELPAAEIDGHLHYYEEYISESVRAGKSESQVLEELGSPVFIAKTLLDTAEAAETGGREYGYRSESYGSETEETAESRGNFERHIHTWNISPFVAKWVIPIVAVVIIFLLLSLLGSVVALAARFFVPILLVVLVIAIFKSHGDR
ncbi:MAG: DUF1700 domain-containing protein [Eubacteriales bacterium]|nr:DUF1700 domain-containing protein [Eubacteriales bacterium]